MFAKKSLGQNFLKSKEALRALIEAGKIDAEDIVLEVGPGKGVLTTELLKRAKKVVAVEKDSRLIEELNEKFSEEIKSGKLELVEGDILEFDPTPLGLRPLPSKGRISADIFSRNSNEENLPSEGRISADIFSRNSNEENLPSEGSGHSDDRGVYKIIANIPYYITGSFLQKFLESEFQPSKMVLMLQKEVARRIVGEGRKAESRDFFLQEKRSVTPPGGPNLNGKESILSISVKAYGTPKYIMTVKAKYFSPEPNVDSAIILIDKISKDFFTNLSEAVFFKIVKAGFAHKRKMLIGNLKSVAGDKNLKEIFIKNNIPPKTRAEDITLNDWAELSKDLG